MRKRQLLFGVLVTGIISLSFSSLAIAGDEHHACPPPVKVVVFQQCQGGPCVFATTGGGAPYSIKFGAFRSPDIKFLSNFVQPPGWHPFNQGTFGADISGLIKVEDTGTYTFTLTSDDGSQLYIDGNLVVDNGGSHGIMTVSNSTMLTKGVHSFTVQFFECCGGASGVDLTLPHGVKYISDEDCKKEED